jgi:hypothetical protein
MSTTTTTTPYPQAGGKLPSEHDGFAIASLVTAFFLPVLGIIFGHLSNHRAKLAHRAKSSLAIAGLILGYLFTGIATLVIIITAVTASTVSSAAAPAPPASSSAPATTPAAPTTPASPAPADTQPPAPSNTGPLATEYTVTTSDGSSYTVAVGSVQNTSLSDSYDSMDHYNDHMVAAQVVIFGKAGQASDDANSDLTVIGSDGQVYQPSFHDTTAGTNFDSGTFHVGPGQMVRGVVNFELPHGVTVQSLQWSPGVDGATATWTVAG